MYVANLPHIGVDVYVCPVSGSLVTCVYYECSKHSTYSTQMCVTKWFTHTGKKVESWLPTTKAVSLFKKGSYLVVDNSNLSFQLSTSHLTHHGLFVDKIQFSRTTKCLVCGRPCNQLFFLHVYRATLTTPLLYRACWITVPVSLSKLPYNLTITLMPRSTILTLNRCGSQQSVCF